MKLILSIVNSDDARPCWRCCPVKDNVPRMVSTTGGFLREGNSTILIGVEDEQMDAVLSIIRENCQSRKQFVNPLPPIMEPGELYMPAPVEIEVGGATVFVLDVERFERF